VSLSAELERIVDAAAAHAGPGERVDAVLATEPRSGRRVYICSFANGEGRSWLALDGEGEPVRSRELVREAVALAALCELAEENAGVDVEHPRLATPSYLDEIGTAAPGLGAALDTVDALAEDVEHAYKGGLS
jgi:hypothetical protein